METMASTIGKEERLVTLFSNISGVQELPVFIYLNKQDASVCFSQDQVLIAMDLEKTMGDREWALVCGSIKTNNEGINRLVKWITEIVKKDRSQT
ncbi:hypothetical protein TrLO_g12503 [Triparma laevis f. longispina]|uniref:Uncharacterized protein n=1 Tax=Triparma laevis f. longispina TaxID=1714387 RepID=A0A9W7KWU4_9STRA|nr:hypothetical protein TrLO_g12503 [Triparma laevis f. longispina]